MDTHTERASIFFTPAMAMVPPIVTIFTMLRQGECEVNELGYPELSCTLAQDELPCTGEAASKLTAALSIHVVEFLGLSCTENDENNTVTYTARFSNLMSAKEVEDTIALRAADLIDTLMAIG